MRNNFYKGELDLLIIDIDDTFIYHRTVAIANKIFLKLIYELFGKKINNDQLYRTKDSFKLMLKIIITNFSRFKPRNMRKILRLIKAALYLHFLNIVRNFNNKFFRITSSEKIIKVWIKTVISNDIKADELQLSKKSIEKNLNKEVLNVYNNLRKNNPKMKVLSISQNFMVKNNPIKELLRIDFAESNKFISKNGILTGYEINVKNKEDKKRIAENIIKRLGSKNIGIFIDDYDDLSLLKLENLRFVLYKRKLKRFICNKHVQILSF
ncbi:hypothetical protein HQ533_06550 [Candidatus Woesearchaeota archaeon]|nr:hypothetical protein [Candidatus Woesearchaeota archaeon]